MAEDSTNALGLEFSQLNVQEKQETDSVKNNDNAEAPDESDQPTANPALSTTNRKEREKPYVNPERVKTGGSQRVRSLLPGVLYRLLTIYFVSRTSCPKRP